jgi:tRNA G18 (ribose-2'-O)-methylase SpoU
MKYPPRPQRPKAPQAPVAPPFSAAGRAPVPAVPPASGADPGEASSPRAPWKTRERAGTGGPREDRPRGPASFDDPPRAAPRGSTDLILGLRAGLAVFARRSHDIAKITYSEAIAPEIANLLRFAENHGIPSLALREDELTKMTGTKLHEGLAIAAKARVWHSPADLGPRLVREKRLALAFDRVRNPYNVGAALRSAAFFGVDAALLGPVTHPGVDAMTIRVAEGGVESLLLSRTTDLAESLSRFRAAGVRVIGADGASPTSALGYPFAAPMVLVLGHEREGLSERVRAQCDAVVAIPGTGAVESLNVAVAAGVLIAEMTRGRWARR